MHDKYQQLYSDFVEDERLRGRRPQGFAGVIRRVKKFFVYLEDMELDVYHVKPKDALGYQTWLKQTGKEKGGSYTNSTISSYVNAALNLYAYLQRNNKVSTNPFCGIKKILPDKIIPRGVLKEKDIVLILTELADYDSEKHLTTKMIKYRAHVIAELVYATGMRISEVGALTVDDIDFERGLVYIREGKGGHERVGYLNEYACNILKIFVTKMRKVLFTQSNNRNNTLFGVMPSRMKKLLNTELKKVCQKLGLPHTTAHKFRHALGYHLLRAGCDIRYIQEILGHTQIKSTEIYTKVDKEGLKQVLQTYHPRQFTHRDRNEEE